MEEPPQRKGEAIISSVKKLRYSCLKPKQLEIVMVLLDGRDVFGNLPTGYGKSLCFAAFFIILNKLLEVEIEAGEKLIVEKPAKIEEPQRMEEPPQRKGEAINSAVKKLGYSCLKPKQLEIVTAY